MLDKIVVAIIGTAINILLTVENKRVILKERTSWLPTEKILATPWNTMRLTNCEQRLKNGEKAPAIEVELVICPGGAQSFYTISDGNHRVAAAAGLGYPKVLAHINGTVYIDAQVVLNREDNSVWEVEQENQGLRLIEQDVSDEVMTCLEKRFGCDSVSSLDAGMANLFG